MAALSVCLSFNSLLTKFDTTRRDLLLGFHRNTYHPESIGENNYNISSPRQQKVDIELGADTHNSDLQVMEIDQQSVFGENSTWFSQKRVIRNTLEEFSPHCNDSRDTNQELYQLLNTYRESTQMDDRLFLELATCMQKWCLFVDNEEKKQNYENNTNVSGNNDALSSEPSDKDYPRECSIMLSRWAIEASAALKNTNSKALLATILLCSSNKLTPQNGCNSMTEIPDALEIKSGGKEFEKWFTSLTEILCRDNIDDEQLTDTNGDRDILLQATMKNLRNRQVQKLLSNLLDLTKSPRLILLINHILRQPQNAELKLIVSLLARGDSIAGEPQQHEDESFSSKCSMHNKTNWGDAEDSESEEEDFDQRPSSHKKARGGSTQCKRQEILTMVKLDRYYSERIQQAINKHKHAFDASTIEVATKITKAPWKEWGLYILGEGTNKEAVGIDNNVSHIDKVEADCYVETLGYLLQASSSMRLVTRFTPLSPLAFNPTILSTLWNMIRNEGQRGYILSIFSDLFSHYMLALSDEDFIKYHCSNDSTVEFGIRINAKDLVTRYGQELHELYWTKPVVCSEIQMDSVRGRLIMSGTKLWNSLYERWNRLVNISFCKESAWWFPPMGSKEGDGAVLPDGELGYGASEGDDDDSMDVDEDRNQLSTAEAATDALADSFRDPKMARVLTSVPQALPFDRRVKLFHSLLKADKQKVAQAYSSRRALMNAMRGPHEDEGETMMWLDGSIREQIKIKRASLYRDSMEKLNKLGTKLKHKIQVTFINKHGSEEPGIDGGGVFKEFLDDLIIDGFAATNEDETDGGAPRLFSITTKQQQLTMNLDLTEDKNMLVHYEFLGRVLGKAVYESILVEPQFCLPFLNQLLGKVNALEDLKNYDEEYYNNLNKLRHYTEEEIDSLGLTFELTVGSTSSKSTHRTINLVRSGRSIAVTKRNAFQYSQAVANELLNVLGAHQTRAFLRGFRDLIKVAWVRLFSAKELQKLISGDDSIRGIDVTSLKKSVQYLGGYHESQSYIQDFWDILENELSPEQQRKFLRFMTSCSRQPLLGFSSLEPFPAIQQIRLQSNELSKNSRLPTSSTCMNLLKLPNYQDRKLLKEKLLAAVESGAGFELT